MVQNGLLALLERGPMYGYQLRAEFEASTGATWPLNIGQVYTTLARLERDGLVEPSARPTTRAASPTGSPTPAAPRSRDGSRTPGRAGAPPARRAGDQARDGADHAGGRRPPVIQTQRTATLRSLQDLTRLKAQRRRGGRRRLAAGAGVDDLQGRGRGPLARPLRGPDGRARGPRPAGPRPRAPSTEVVR